MLSDDEDSLAGTQLAPALSASVSLSSLASAPASAASACASDVFFPPAAASRSATPASPAAHSLSLRLPRPHSPGRLVPSSATARGLAAAAVVSVALYTSSASFRLPVAMPTAPPLLLPPAWLALLALAGLALLAHAVFCRPARRSSKLMVAHQHALWQRRLLRTLRHRTRLFRFRPVPLLRQGDVASMLCLGRPVLRPPYREHSLRMSCGGTVGYFVLEPDTAWPQVQHCTRYTACAPQRLRLEREVPVSARPTVIILPGVGGSHGSVFACAVARQCYERGFRAVVKAYRGCAVPLTSPKTFSLGGCGDLAEVVRSLRRDYPQSPLYLAGFSMGANISCNFLGTLNADPSSDLYHSVKGAAVFCNGFFLDYESLRHRLRGLYDYAVLRNVKRAWVKYASPETRQALAQHAEIDIKKILAAKSLQAYDQLVLKPVYGYETVEAYAQAESSGHHLHRVQVPLLCVNATDDPLFTPSLHRRIRDTVRRCKNIAYIETEWGGHLGFLERMDALWNVNSGPHLMEEVVIEALAHFWEEQQRGHTTTIAEEETADADDER